MNPTIHFLDQHLQKLFQTMTRGGTKTKKLRKNSSDLKELERDPTPVKISKSNSKNSRSYSIFTKQIEKSPDLTQNVQNPWDLGAEIGEITL